MLTLLSVNGPYGGWRSIAALTLFLAALASAPSRAITLGSAEAGNLFVEGTPLRMTAREAQGEVRFTLRDYYGRVAARSQVVSAQGLAQIELPAVPPGWYELTAQDAAGECTVSLGVVRDRQGAPLPFEGKICADAASAWLLKEDSQRRPFARMVRLAGIPWVRERLSWTATEPEAGRFDWKPQYQLTAEAFAAEGVHVDEIWHDSPPWVRPGQAATLAPDDLRTVYQFTRAAATHFAPTVAAWEVWNEPDISFWPGLSDRFAGLQKAAFWGIKDGSPAARVLNGAFARPAGAFGFNLYHSGIGDYSDLFNWHLYADPLVYPADLSAHRALVQEAGAPQRPAWLTEAGISLPGSAGEGKRQLSAEDQRRQARFIPRSAALSLAAGDAKHFFFVLPDYLENGVQFGALKPDLTPYPSFLALSAAADLLGMSEYEGRYPAPANVQAYLFRTPQGSVLVAWSDQPTRLSLPVTKNKIRVADLFGADSAHAATGGLVTLDVGPEAIYVLDPGSLVTGRVPRPKPSLKTSGRARVLPSRVVLMGYADFPIDKDQDRYRLKDVHPFAYTVEAYNFDATKEHDGQVGITPPPGWTARETSRPVRLAPMGRQTMTFLLTPSTLRAGEAYVTATARFAGERISPAQSRFALDPALLTPQRRRALDWADPAKWDASNVAAGGKTTLSAPKHGTLRAVATFEGTGDRWAYPTLPFASPMDLSEWDGLAFQLKTESGTPNSWVRLMLDEPSGSTYVGPAVTAPDGPRRIVLLFRDFEWGPFSPADPDGKLDLNKIKLFQMGCNTPGSLMAFEASDFELVKFAEPAKGQ